MSFQISSIPKLNGVRLLTESEISALSNNDVFGIDKTTLNPILKAAPIQSFVGTDITVQNTHTNSITSIGTNDNLAIQPNGTGSLIFNTLQNGGLTFNTSVADNWALFATNSTATRRIVLGTYFLTTDRPAIGGNTSVPTWCPMWLQGYDISTNANSYVVVGDLSESVASSTGCKLISQGRISSYNIGIDFKSNLSTTKITLGTSSASAQRVHTLTDRNSIIAPSYFIEQKIQCLPTANLVPAAALTAVAYQAWRGTYNSVVNGTTGAVQLIFIADIADTIDIDLYDETNSVILGSLAGFNVGLTPTPTSFPFTISLLSVDPAVLSIRIKIVSGSATNINLLDSYYTLGADSY